MKTKPKSKTDNLVTMNLENESLIYDLKNNRAYCLNKTSAMVWESCDGKTSTSEISNLLSYKLKTLVSEEFIWLALDELKKNNLLENGEILNNYFPNLSRREIVKKIGLASMVALPIISSIVAPSAVMAVSCGGQRAPGSQINVGENFVVCGTDTLCSQSGCDQNFAQLCQSCNMRYENDCSTSNPSPGFTFVRCTCTCL